MRHLHKGRKLGRNKSARNALLKNLAISLIEHEQITTTLPKAKELRSYVERIITIGKKDTLANRRNVFAKLRHDFCVNKVFSTLAKRYKDRHGGYTRVLKAGFRHGDNAPIAIIELVDRNIEAKGLKDKERAKQNKDHQE